MTWNGLRIPKFGGKSKKLAVTLSPASLVLCMYGCGVQQPHELRLRYYLPIYVLCVSSHLWPFTKVNFGFCQFYKKSWDSVRPPSPWLGQNPKFVKGNFFGAPLNGYVHHKQCKILLDYFSKVSSLGSKQVTNPGPFPISEFSQTRMSLLIWIVSPCFSGISSSSTISPFTLFFTCFKGKLEVIQC